MHMRLSNKEIEEVLGEEYVSNKVEKTPSNAKVDEHYLIEACILFLEKAVSSDCCEITDRGTTRFDPNATVQFQAYTTLINHLERFPNGLSKLRQQIVKLGMGRRK